jgi:2-methylisocitrate lyase-like PEP mutase family enzyme
MKKSSIFRNLLKKRETIVMPGSYDPLSAKIIEWAGFPAVYMSGAGAAAAVLCAPDLGFMTMTEVVRQARNIVNAVKIPVIADSDTGYGDALNMTRTIKEFERAGVAGIHIEDLEKHQCGLHAGKTLLSTEEMVGRIKASRDHLEDRDFVLIARTDAIGAIGGGVEEAVKRANLYAEAGADAIWVQEPPVAQQTDEMFATVAKSVKAPLMVAAGYNKHSISQFEEWGYKIVFYPTLSLQTTMKTLMNLMKDIKEKGRDKAFCNVLPDRGVSFEEFMDFTEFYKNQQIRDKYVPKK